MKTTTCSCGQIHYFHSLKCVRCGKLVGLCPQCQSVSQLLPAGDDFRCGNDKCKAELSLCANREQYLVCNGTVSAAAGSSLCSFCSLNSVIPDLSIEGNLEKWRRLETAKHRVLQGVIAVGLPITADDNGANALRFEFKADGAEPVATGHLKGCITINLREADHVEREKTRVAFGEPQRTLVGHFRHELGHYYWERIVQPTKREDFRGLFGYEQNPSYAEAQKRYYEQGPPDDWSRHFISGYAAMHPWEDFAETFATYLDMRAILETATSFELAELDPPTFATMLEAYKNIGIAANELNRDMGLLDLVPEVLSPEIVKKLEFIHGLPPQDVPAAPPISTQSRGE